MVAPAENSCVNPNKATKVDEPCSTPGNSAWNTHTTSRTSKPADAQAPPYPGHALHLQVAPAENACVNPNKATKVDEPCDTPGNSAWNTHTTSRTAKPADAQAPPYPGHALHLQVAPAENACVNPNKATKVDEPCDTPGNSAWNTHTTSRTAKPADAQAPPYPGHALHLQVAPAENSCVNPNKATKVDEPCSTPGNSAWNTHTTSRTAKPADAQAPPYPGHALHLQVDPLTNTCVNPNKATKVDELCSAAGNSAWNTHTTSRTGKPADAQAAPYPGHTLH